MFSRNHRTENPISHAGSGSGCERSVSYLWVMAKVWVFDRFSVGTEVVDPKKYGLWLSMGYERYGL